MSDDNNELSPAQQKGVLDAKRVLGSKQNVLKIIGRIEAFDFISKLLSVGGLKDLMELKNSKEYKGLVYNGEDGELLTIGTWEEFCKHFLKSSRATVDEKLQNLNVLGEEYFQAADKIGLSVQHLRKLRKLPDEGRLEAMSDDVLASGDRDVIQDHIDDIVEKHTKETGEVKKQLKDANADINALRQINREAQDNIEKLRSDLERQKFKPEDWPQELSGYIEQLMVSIEPLHQAISKTRQCIDELHSFMQRPDIPLEAKEAIPQVIVGTTEAAANAAALMHLEWADHLGNIPRRAAYNYLVELANLSLPEDQQFPLEED